MIFRMTRTLIYQRLEFFEIVFDNLDALNTTIKHKKRGKEIDT